MTPHRIQGNLLLATVLLTANSIALAAGGSPFSTGSSALSTDLLTILTPVAAIAVMALGVLAWFGRISWGFAVSCMVGIVLVFGSQQIVSWIRGLAGV